MNNFETDIVGITYWVARANMALVLADSNQNWATLGNIGIGQPG